eukprot:jgi/Psemu1/24218/gm1.24218_g
MSSFISVLKQHRHQLQLARSTYARNFLAVGHHLAANNSQTKKKLISCSINKSRTTQQTIHPYVPLLKFTSEVNDCCNFNHTHYRYHTPPGHLSLILSPSHDPSRQMQYILNPSTDTFLTKTTSSTALEILSTHHATHNKIRGSVIVSINDTLVFTKQNVLDIVVNLCSRKIRSFDAVFATNDKISSKDLWRNYTEHNIFNPHPITDPESLSVDFLSFCAITALHTDLNTSNSV